MTVNSIDTPIHHPTPPLPSESSALAAALSDKDIAILQTAVPEKAKAFLPDNLAFWRELPRLLAEGEDGRCALVHGGRVVSLWDTLSDAAQAGHTTFGPDAMFLTPVIRRLELERIRQFLAQECADC